MFRRLSKVAPRRAKKQTSHSGRVGLNIEELLARLRDLDIRIWEDEGHLRCSGDPKVLTDDLRQEIAGHEEKILRRLADALDETTSKGTAPQPHDTTSPTEVVRRVFAETSGSEMKGIIDNWAKKDDWLKNKVVQGYDAYHENVRATPFWKESIFLNLGYIPNSNPQYSKIELPKYMLNRKCIKLVLEVIGDCSDFGRAVLDIGCGRGGTIWTLHEFFDIKAATGLDLSKGAISFCREVHRFPNTEFIVGDAESLPFADASFDVIVNLESSHHYPNVFSFYDEVYRSLSVNGRFLYATLLPAERFRPDVEYLTSIGFDVLRNQDVTTNVLASCEEMAGAQYVDLGREGVDAIAANASALPGTPRYERMKNGQEEYRVLNLRKL